MIFEKSESILASLEYRIDESVHELELGLSDLESAISDEVELVIRNRDNTQLTPEIKDFMEGGISQIARNL